MNEKEENNLESNNENNISNINSKKLSLINENQIITNDSRNDILLEDIKEFECEILNRGKINKIILIINKQKKNIELKICTNIISKENKDISKQKNYIHFKTIDQIDFISFMTQEDINEVKINEIKNSLFLETNDINKENSSLLNKEEICSLTYYPFILKSACNCCRCFFCCDCKCKNNYSIREFTTDYFLIKKDYIIQIKKYLYNISLPKLNKLQSKDRKRKILAFINPIGGKGNALNIWEKAKKIFIQANLDIDTIITQQFKEAYNYILTLDPMKYDGFICCSGDGIIHEIINAIFHINEEDKNKFLEHCAICALPAGSGNALSKAISSYCGDDNRIETHCYYLCKGIKKK